MLTPKNFIAATEALSRNQEEFDRLKVVVDDRTRAHTENENKRALYTRGEHAREMLHYAAAVFKALPDLTGEQKTAVKEALITARGEARGR